MSVLTNFDLDATRSGTNGALSYVEGTGAMLLAANAIVSATGSFSGETLTISGLLATDRIGFGDLTIAGKNLKIGHNMVGSFTGGTNGADLVINFAHGVVASDVETLLRYLTFLDTSNSPTSHALTINLAGTVRTELLTPTPINHAPVVDLNGAAAGTSAALSYMENGVATAIAPNANVSDASSADFNGGSLTVAFAPNGTSADQLTIGNQGTGAGQIGVSGSDLTYGGTVIGTFAGGTNGTDLVVTFNSSSATAAAAQALLRDIRYSNTSDNPSVTPRTVTYALNDGDGTANGGTNIGSATATINVTAVNDPPMGANDSGSAVEKGGTSNASGGSSATGNVLINDTDVDHTQASLTVSAICTGSESGTGTSGTLGLGLVGAHGTLTLNSNGAYTYLVNEDDAAVQALHAGTFLTDSFTYTVRDPGGLTDTAELVITVGGANDAPTTTLVTLTEIAEDSGARLITQAELLANAADVDGPALTATSLAIASGNGALLDNGDGTWSYTPAADDDTSVSFSYTVTDGTLTASGSASLDITPVDDPHTSLIKLTEPLAGLPGQNNAYWSPDGTRLFLASTTTLTTDDPDGGTGMDLFSADLANGDKTLLTASVAAGLEGDSWFAGWSPDGTKLVLGSTSTLTPDDTDDGNIGDLFVLDLTSGAKTLLTAPVAGTHGESSFAGWSTDGAKLLLQSTSALTADDTDGGTGNDLFVVDLATGGNTLLTAPVAGGAEGTSSFAGWSPDGANIVLQSTASLTSNDTDGLASGWDLFSVNLATGAKTLLTQSAPGGAEGSSSFVGWSSDGTTVVLKSNATLTADDTDGGSGSDVFAVDLITGGKTLLTLPFVGEADGYSEVAGWSPDGETLLLGSDGSLTADDTDGGSGMDLFAVDLATGGKTLLTKSVASGSESDSWLEGWSPDGTKLVLGSFSTLTPDDTDGGAGWDLFVEDLMTGDKTLLTAPIAGGNDDSFRFAGWSPDGSKLMLASTSTLTPDDTNGGDWDLFALDLSTGHKTLLTASVTGGFEGDSDFILDVSTHGGPVWSADGHSVQVLTTSTLVDADLDNGGLDIYWLDLTTGSKSLVDLGFEAGSVQYPLGEAGPDETATLIGAWAGGVGDYYLLT